MRTGAQSRHMEAGTEAGAVKERSYWFAPHDLLCLLSCTPQDYLPRGGTTPPVGWAPSCQSPIKKPSPHTALPTGNLVEGGSLFSDDPSSSRVGKKQNKKPNQPSYTDKEHYLSEGILANLHDLPLLPFLGPPRHPTFSLGCIHI